MAPGASRAASRSEAAWVLLIPRSGSPRYAPNKSMRVLLVFFCRIIHSECHFAFLLPTDSL